MKLSVTLAFAAASCGTVAAWNPTTPSPASRRELLQQTAFVATSGLAFLAKVDSAHAIEACPKGSKNCIRTTWTPPAGTSKADMAKTVKEVLSTYPQEGQADVDKGGWKIVEDFNGGDSARVEFTSGIGNFAKFFNGGKPFIDDVVLELTDGGVEVRSSSRIGDSDLGVNQKRLQFLAAALNGKGWTAPEPQY